MVAGIEGEGSDGANKGDACAWGMVRGMRVASGNTWEIYRGGEIKVTPGTLKRKRAIIGETLCPGS